MRRAFRDRRQELKLGPLVIHANYLINLASPNPVLRTRSIQAFHQEIVRAVALGADFLVVHPGCADWEHASNLRSRRSRQSIKQAARGREVRRLANPARKYSRAGKLARLAVRGIEGHSRRVPAICRWACASIRRTLSPPDGIFAPRKGCRPRCSDIDRIIGLDRVAVVHVNDSKAAARLARRPPRAHRKRQDRARSVRQDPESSVARANAPSFWKRRSIGRATTAAMSRRCGSYRDEPCRAKGQGMKPRPKRSHQIAYDEKQAFAQKSSVTGGSELGRIRSAADRSEVAEKSGRSRTRSAPSTTIPPARNIICSKCCRIPPALCTWATCATTRSAMRWRATSGCADSTCCIRWAGTHSDCLPKTPRSSAELRRANGRTRNIAQMKAAFCKRFGFSYDWQREISTCEPEYYRWNQWFFLRMLERGSPTARRSRVNWCPAMPDRAGERAGDRRVLLAARNDAGRSERNRAVVPAHHADIPMSCSKDMTNSRAAGLSAC